jgi:hypothetical protein
MPRLRQLRCKKRKRGAHKGITVFVLVTRVLASLIAVCLVAAAGVRPASAAPARPLTLDVPHTLATLRARVLDAVPPGRATPGISHVARAAGAPGASQASRPAGAPRSSGAPGAHDLLAIVGDDAFRLAPLAASPADRIAGRSLVLRLRWLSTHPARGPPVV